MTAWYACAEPERQPDPAVSDPIDAATAVAMHLDRLAKMAEPFGYELVETTALEALRAEAFQARLHRIAAQRASTNSTTTSIPSNP